jgi:signal transduction histidine kinase
MLAFARRQELQPERVSLAKLAHGMAELMERSLGPTITVDIQIPDDLPLVEVDPNQLESALLNLALNALDAMGGEGPLRISAREGISSGHDHQLVGRFVCLAVEDKGEGMDERNTLRTVVRLTPSSAHRATPRAMRSWSHKTGRPTSTSLRSHRLCTAQPYE